jgi:Rieske Fe-S protein
VENRDSEDCPCQSSGRRDVLKAALGLGLSIPFLNTGFAATEEDPTKMSPQEGDRLVYFAGDKKGQVIKPEDLPMGGPQELAYPMDASSGTVRDGSLLNMIAVIRMDPKDLTKKTQDSAAGGIVAYSAICTHQGCPVSMWRKEEQTLFCSCHGSQYDPKDGAKVVFGPAQKRLAALPVKLDEGAIVVAGKFSRRVGADQR